MIDLSKMTPAPWHVGVAGHAGVVVEQDHNIRLVLRSVGNAADDAGAAMCRNALDVQMRRQWGVRPVGDGWQAIEWRAGWPIGVCTLIKPDPVTAILAADAWLREQEGEA